MEFTVILVFELFYVLQVYVDPCCDVVSSLAIWSFTFITTLSVLVYFLWTFGSLPCGVFFFFFHLASVSILSLFIFSFSSVSALVLFWSTVMSSVTFLCLVLHLSFGYIPFHLVSILFLCNCLLFPDCLRLCFHLCLFLFVISQSHASVHVVPFSLCSQTRLLFILTFVFLLFWIQFYFMSSFSFSFHHHVFTMCSWF